VDSEVSQLNLENSNNDEEVSQLNLENDEEVSQLNLPSKLENKIQNCIVIRVTDTPSVETPIQECEKRYSSDYNKQRKCLYNIPEITSCFTLYG
jgi:hypothetical protein